MTSIPWTTSTMMCSDEVGWPDGLADRDVQRRAISQPSRPPMTSFPATPANALSQPSLAFAETSRTQQRLLRPISSPPEGPLSSLHRAHAWWVSCMHARILLFSATLTGQNNINLLCPQSAPSPGAAPPSNSATSPSSLSSIPPPTVSSVSATPPVSSTLLPATPPAQPPLAAAPLLLPPQEAVAGIPPAVPPISVPPLIPAPPPTTFTTLPAGVSPTTALAAIPPSTGIVTPPVRNKQYYCI